MRAGLSQQVSDANGVCQAWRGPAADSGEVRLDGGGGALRLELAEVPGHRQAGRHVGQPACSPMRWCERSKTGLAENLQAYPVVFRTILLRTGSGRRGGF